MKIACTADWHIHQFQDFSKQMPVRWDYTIQRYVPFSQGKEMNSRLYYILDGICDIRDYCIKNQIKYVLNAGDTFHKRGNINVDTFNAAYQVIETFQKSGISLFSIAGNHDQVDSSDIPSTSIHTLGIIQRVIEQSTKISLDRQQVVAIPYSANKDLIMETLSHYMSSLDTSKSILLMHCGVTGAGVGSGMYAMKDEYSLEDLQPEKWKFVVLGHYHRPQMLANNVFYCGTPVQESFNDELPDSEHKGYNGFYVIDTVSGDIEFVPIYKPRFITLKSPENIEEGNYYRFQVEVSDWDSYDESTKETIQKAARVEITKDYSVAARSSIGLSDDLVTTIKKYSKEQKITSDTLAVGLQLLLEASEKDGN